MKKRYINIINTLLIILLSSCQKAELSSCQKAENLNLHIVSGTYSKEYGYLSPMNTVVSLKMYYQNQYDKVVKEFDNIIQSLSLEVDRYHDYENVTNIKTINDSCGTNNEIILSNDLYELISLGIDLTKITKGAFNLAMGSIIDLYEPYFNEDSPGLIKDLPSQLLINEALSHVPTYDKIEKVIELNENNKSIKLNKYNDNNVILSLGAIAKGFVMQKAYDYLKTYDYPLIIDAGSSTMATMNNNPLKKDKMWTIGFQKPLINNNDLLCSIKSKGDLSISTSGDYRLNFFYQDENDSTKLMHHIIDSNTGISNNYVRSVTLVSNNANLAILDAISTAIFNIEKQEDVDILFNNIKTKYNYNINYLITKPYQNSFDKFEVVLNEDFNKILSSNFDEDIKKVSVIK